mgnify:CR=1 FL=1|tara:strand:- start:737 stop:1504 length:768 start_codon:yes stop_codon:yes gene_type:complete
MINSAERVVVDALQVDGVTKMYGSLVVLGPLSFRVPDGEFVAVLGPSGCGKSTLLSLLAGLSQPSGGRLLVRGRDADHLGPHERTMVFQQDGLLPWRTVRRNISLGLEYRHADTDEAHRLVREVLEQVGLCGFEEYYPHQLSGGMRQRTAIARALVMQPAILLMDEPYGSLDAMTRMQMHEELLRIWKGSGRTIVMVTHDVDEALSLADRVMVLSSRPAHLKADLSIAMSRPRDRSSADYTKTRTELLTLLGLTM